MLPPGGLLRRVGQKQPRWPSPWENRQGRPGHALCDAHGHYGQHACGGAACGGAVMAELAVGLHVEHHGGTGDPPGKEKMMVAHRRRRAVVRWQKRGGSTVLGGGGGTWWPAIALMNSWSRRGR
jgi:hypothetical protein